MRADVLVNTQLLMAQALDTLADHVNKSIGYGLTPVTFAELPVEPVAGMLTCVTDSTVSAWGGVIAGGGTNTVLAFYDGINWVVK